MGTGGLSFQHILKEFSLVFPNTITFTGQWPGYASGYEDTFNVKEVGSTRYIEFGKVANGYTIGFSYASPQIINQLLKFKPTIIFANAFTGWTAIALLMKQIGRWKVIIIYEGGSSTYEDPNSIIRYRARRLMTKLADAFVVNSQAGKTYLVDVLQVKPKTVFARPFLVPDVEALTQYSAAEIPQFDSDLKRPVFLYVGQIVPRKGLKNLLNACLQLRQNGYTNFTIMIVGDGDQRSILEAWCLQYDLAEQVIWTGKIPYRCLGAYFQAADVFVFPTYDDIWGMVLTEAMAFGKPVICSTGAGAVEMIVERENGFIFNPEQIDQLADGMRQFIDNPDLISRMGSRSIEIMRLHSPAISTQTFVQIVELVRE